MVAFSSWSDAAGECFFWFGIGRSGGGVCMGFFEIPAGALRRAQLADELPVEILPVFQELSELVLGLPDPAGVRVEERRGAVQAAARLQTMLEA